MQLSAAGTRQAGHSSNRRAPVSARRCGHARLKASGTETHAAVATSSNAADTAAEGRCPFLASLPDPPSAKMFLWDRVKEIFDPPVFQRAAMKFSGAAGMVYLPRALALPAQYLAGNPEQAKRVLAEADGEFIMSAAAGFEPIVELFGKHNMLLSPEPRHSYLRSLMQPAFTPEAVAGNLPRLEAVISTWMERWAAQGGAVKGYDGLKSMTFDFILQAVFDRQWEPQAVARLSQIFATFTDGLLAWPFLDIPFTPFAAAVAARKELLQEFSNAVEETRAALAAGQPQRSVVGMLLVAEDEQGNRLTDVELLDNLLLLLVAGHDTSSSTLTLALANLQQHPEVMQRLRQEQTEVVAKHGTAMTSAAIRDMVYADAVIRETLRKDNIVANTARTAAKDLDMAGTIVPAGATMQVPFIYLAEQDPRWAGEAPGSPMDPAAFVPKRMLTKEGAKPGSLMPFGHGPRFCLGYYLAMVEMKVFLALLARGYDFTADTNTEWGYAVGKVPKNRLPLTLTPLAQPLA